MTNNIADEEITEYRKSIKIYDVFTFFNEFELLEIRLNILEPYVDYFVIVEATETFSGLPKKLYFEEKKHLFEKYKDIIIHYVIDDTPADEGDLRRRLQNKNLSDLDREIINNALTSDNVPKGVIHWLKEFYQKEMIKKALIGLSDNDICFISDVDEIWNPEAKIDYTRDDIFKLKQDVYAYYLNNRSSEPWAGTLVTKYKNIRSGVLNHLRTAGKTKYTYIDNGGWHFTNQGGADQIQKKIEASYGPEDLNKDDIKSKIKMRMLKNQDYIGRKFRFWVDEKDLPKYILENKTKYQHSFKPTNSARGNSAESIIIKFQGGLGNQLFQYALGRNLSLTKKIKVKYDISWFAGQTKRKYELDNFKAVIEFATSEEVGKLQRYKRKTGKLSFFHNFFRANKNIYVNEKEFTFDPTILNTNPPTYLDGYWQSEKYFVSIQEIIRKDLTLKVADSPQIKGQRNEIVNSHSVSLHIRRTDYINNSHSFYHICPLDYYYKAISYLEDKNKGLKLFIFSDDIAWVKENFKTNHPTVFIEGNKSYEDLLLMSLCQYNIIANSSFSWWGAWLNVNPEKIIIAPNKWFNDPKINTQDLIPANWIKI